MGKINNGFCISVISISSILNKKPHRQLPFERVQNSIRSVQWRPANCPSYNHPLLQYSLNNHSLHTIFSSAPPWTGSNLLVLLLWTCLLVHHGIRSTQIPLRILEFLNHAMLALLALISNQFTVPFLDFLVNQATTFQLTNRSEREAGVGSGEHTYLNLLINVFSIQIHHYSGLGLSNTRLILFHDAAHQFVAGIGKHGQAVFRVAGVAGRVGFEVPSPDVSVEGFSCMRLRLVL